MKKFYSLLIILTLSVSRLLAQSGSLQGKVTDLNTKEGIPFAVIELLQNGILITGTTSDVNGNYAIKPIVPGKYGLEVISLGYDTGRYVGIEVNADVLSFRDVKMGKASHNLKQVIITDNQLLKTDVITGSTYSGTNIQQSAIQRSDINSVVALTGGVAQSDVGAGININGSRSYSQRYVVDGIPMTGTIGLPSDAIEQLTVLTGGIPARYGDATGGVITVTTRGPSRDFHGGIEASTSYLVDVDHYRLISADLSGPLFTKNKKSKGTAHDSSDTKLGFFINAEYEGNDGGKSAVGYYKIKNNSLLDSIQKYPLRPAPFGSGYVPSAAYVNASDLQKINLVPNSTTNTYRLAGKIDYKLNNYINLIVGGNMEYYQLSGIGLTQTLFDPTIKSSTTEGTYRGYARFTQRFGSNKSGAQQSASVFQNAYYSIQVDYTKFYEKSEDPTKGFNPFLYGYIGQFKTYRQAVYAPGSDTLTDGKGHYLTDGHGNYRILNGQVFLGYRDTLVTYKPSDINQLMANYTTQYYTLSGSTPVDGVYGLKNTDGLSYADALSTGDVGGQVEHYSNLSQIQSTGGLVNGEPPPTVYSMWNNSGSPVGGYGLVNNDQYHLSFYGSVDVVKASSNGKDQNRHALEFGIDYEQRVGRNYSVSPIGLWTLATQLANSHIQNFDTKNPVPVYRNGIYQDTLNYNRLVGSQQNFFDKSLRQKLGLSVSGTDFIDVNSLDPSVFALNMFTADELESQNLVGGHGYDFLGNIYTKQPSFNDYFTQQDANGNYTRPIAAFRPIYAAAYLQDNFSFRDLIFNVGVRVDRYDANEQVLKDPYLLYPARTAGEVTQLNGQKVNIPSTIGSNYVVYVNDLQNPTQIVGYRNGNVWYDQNGTVTTNPGAIAQASATGKITPYLVNNTSDSLQVNGDAFTSYTPQFTVMPRIKFSFKLSDEALFFAHYDVYSQRPTQNESSPGDYFYLKQFSVNEVINNPDLLPEITIDYQAGFKQTLGKNSVLTISGLYRELKNLVQVQKSYAFPVDYTTYGNSDFGTVKSLILEYEMQRTNNLRLDVNYTLSFADGTGDSQASAAGLINVGETVKPVFPFSYDRRHTITGSLDYRYAEGEYYNGPVLGKNNTQILANTGLDLILTTFSGTPYSRQANPTPSVLSGVATTSTALGSIHGSRLPWTFRIDLKVDKDFKVGKKNNSKSPGHGAHYINVYVLVQNLLNTQNILGVYQYTGNPSNDGYLTSPAGQQTVASQVDPQAFTDLYNIRVNAPGNYSQPRITRVGLSYRF